MPRSWCGCASTWRIAAATLELLLPYATIEPIRDVLLQMFMGEKFGRDPIWEGHLATEIGQAEIAVDAVLYEAKLPLQAADEARGRRHADARAQAGRAGDACAAATSR